MATDGNIGGWIDVMAETYRCHKLRFQEQVADEDNVLGFKNRSGGAEWAEGEAESKTSHGDLALYPHGWSTQEYNVEMSFSIIGEWSALIKINAKDVPALMTRGFHWSEANVDPFQGYVLNSDQLSPGDQYAGWYYARRFFLKDLDNDPQWEAKIEVFAEELYVLSLFRVGHLTMDKLDMVKAWNWDGFEIYRYVTLDPDNSYNAIYDDMPLGKGWPQIRHNSWEK